MDKKLSKLSIPEIIKLAYSVDDDEKYWILIAALHELGNQEVFTKAKSLSRSADPINREIGADILGQLGWKKKYCHDESVQILIELLNDKVPDVVASAACSLGHRNDKRSISCLLKLVNHSCARVRDGVAFGLSTLDDIEAVNGLISLSKDADFDVRNWATFSLGSQCDIDNQDIRLALHERIQDDDAEIRGEAFIGLARRKDITIKQKLIVELSEEFNGIWPVEACSYIPDSDYIPILQRLLENLGPEDRVQFEKEIYGVIQECRKTT